VGTDVPLTKLIVALNVACWFTDEGFTADTRATEVAPEPTDWGYAGEVLLAKFVSPLVYVATKL
jgi:hypothetical protein